MGLTESFVLFLSLLTRASAISKPRYSSPATEVLKGRTATELPATRVGGGTVADRLFQMTIPLITPSAIAIVMTVAITRYWWVRLTGVVLRAGGVGDKSGAASLTLSAGVSTSRVSTFGLTGGPDPFASANSAINR